MLSSLPLPFTHLLELIPKALCLHSSHFITTTLFLDEPFQVHGLNTGNKPSQNYISYQDNSSIAQTQMSNFQLSPYPRNILLWWVVNSYMLWDQREHLLYSCPLQNTNEKSNKKRI